MQWFKILPVFALVTKSHQSQNERTLFNSFQIYLLIPFHQYPSEEPLLICLFWPCIILHNAINSVGSVSTLQYNANISNHIFLVLYSDTLDMSFCPYREKWYWFCAVGGLSSKFLSTVVEVSRSSILNRRTKGNTGSYHLTGEAGRGETKRRMRRRYNAPRRVLFSDTERKQPLSPPCAHQPVHTSSMFASTLYIF